MTSPLCNRCRTSMSPGEGVVPVWVCGECSREVPMEPGVGSSDTSASGAGDADRVRTGPGEYDPRHPHEPEIPPVMADDGHCRVCRLIVERDGLRRQLEDRGTEVGRYRTAIKAALDTMAVANDEQLGPGGVARKAYAHLWHEFFAIPAGIPASTVLNPSAGRSPVQPRTEGV